MSKNLVNLDAIIVRSDFEDVDDAAPKPKGQLPDHFRLNEVVSGTTALSLRKPDFQRETAYWSPAQVSEFIQSFVNGDVIPSVILWRSPDSGNIFIIDGAHRLSALIAWAKDDFGDESHSLRFFENIVPSEQKQAAIKTRRLVKKLAGAYSDLQAAAEYPDNSSAELVLKARNADLFRIPLLWVQGDAQKAEESFYRINSKAVAIDPTELKIIKSRRFPSAVTARAIIRGGVGHAYWADYPEAVQVEIRELAKTIHDILFMPPMPDSPFTTLDLPIAGRSYSGGDSLGLIFDFVCLANGISTSQKKVENGAKAQESIDLNGQETLKYLKSVRRTARMLSGTHPSSLGLHPAVYFYGMTGRYQPTRFLATIGLIQYLDTRNKLKWFTGHRSKFEDFLLSHRHYTNQIVSKHGGRLKSFEPLLMYYQTVLTKIAEGLEPKQISAGLQEGGSFNYLNDKILNRESGTSFSRSIKTIAYLSEAIDKAINCKICGAKISPRSISYDHIVRKQDGGRGGAENAQLTHPYCNTGYKESLTAIGRRERGDA